MLTITTHYQQFARQELNQLTKELKRDREQRLRKWDNALELMREIDRQRGNINYSC